MAEYAPIVTAVESGHHADVIGEGLRIFEKCTYSFGLWLGNAVRRFGHGDNLRAVSHRYA